jgi:hypothetical protein
MKVIGIFIFIFLLTLSINLLMDFYLGYPFLDDWARILNPFGTVEWGEYAMLVILFFIIIGHQLFLSLKNRNDQQNDSN